MKQYIIKRYIIEKYTIDAENREEAKKKMKKGDYDNPCEIIIKDETLKLDKIL